MQESWAQFIEDSEVPRDLIMSGMARFLLRLENMSYAYSNWWSSNKKASDFLRNLGPLLPHEQMAMDMYVRFQRRQNCDPLESRADLFVERYRSQYIAILRVRGES